MLYHTLSIKDSQVIRMSKIGKVPMNYALPCFGVA